MTNIRVKTPIFMPSFFNVLDNMLQEELCTGANLKQPAVNILEKEDHFEIEMMAPGLSKSDFKIALEKEFLTISYEKATSESEQTEKYVKKEFTQTSFKRTFTLNEILDGESISAKYESGILTVNIPKKEIEEVKAKTIEIN